VSGDIEPFKLTTPLVRRLKAAGGEERTEEINELTFRRLKGKDLRGAPSNEVDMGLHLLARSTGLTAAEVDEMEFEDVTAAIEKMESFLPSGRKIGLTSSET
jgi:hypothetical protein